MYTKSRVTIILQRCNSRDYNNVSPNTWVGSLTRGKHTLFLLMNIIQGVVVNKMTFTVQLKEIIYL